MVTFLTLCLLSTTVFCISGGLGTATNLPGYVPLSVPGRSRGHPLFGLSIDPGRHLGIQSNTLIRSCTHRLGPRRMCMKPPSISLRADANVGNPQIAPLIDLGNFLSVQIVGIGEAESREEVGTMFVAPPTELFLGNEEAGWVGLKSFPRALPVPLITRDDRAIIMALPGFSDLQQSTLTAFEIGKALAFTKDVYSGLPFISTSVRDAIGYIYQGRKGVVQTSLEALAHLVSFSSCSLQRLVFDEMESLSDDGFPLGCYLVFREQVGTAYGEPTYSDAEMRLWVPVAAGTALATHQNLPIFLPHYIWQEASCRVDVSDKEQLVSHARLKGMSVHESQPASWRTPLNPNQLAARVRRVAEKQAGASAPEGLKGVPAWKLGALDVLRLNQEETRSLLRSYDIPCKRGQTREELLDKLMPLMDEVARRDVRIQLAVEQENFEAATAAQASKSQRAYLSDQIKTAVKEERFYDAAELQEQLELATMTRADITAEEGTYDRFLDADDWYMETIMRQKKKKASENQNGGQKNQ